LEKDAKDVYKTVLTFIVSKGDISDEAEEILNVLREHLGLDDDDANSIIDEIRDELSGKKSSGPLTPSAKAIKIRNYIHVGQSAYRREDYQQALKYFNEALKIETNHKEALFFKKQCQIKLGDKAPSSGEEIAEEASLIEEKKPDKGVSVPGKSPYSTAAKELLEPLCRACADSGECRWCKGKGTCVWCKGSGDCRPCDGSGKSGSDDCTRCNGTGKCGTCKGTGTCIKCNGTKKCQECSP